MGASMDLGEVRGRRIGFALVPGYPLLAIAAAIEPLRAANLLTGRQLYDLRFIGTGAPASPSSAGAIFEGVALREAGLDYDFVFVVAGGNPLAHRDAALAGWLRALAAQGVMLGGISGGAVMLARAGLMRGRRFTVHWQHHDALRGELPGAVIERRLFVIDRDRYTSAGGIASLDMMHALIAAQHGSALARSVSDWFIHTHVRLADDPQRAGAAARWGIGHPALAAAVELMENHIADPLAVGDLAALTGIGPRALHRAFVAHFGVGASGFSRRLRLEKAAELLRETALPVHEIGVLTGFPNPAHFAREFRRSFGHPPGAQRQQAAFRRVLDRSRP